jgi:hypothetical protein
VVNDKYDDSRTTAPPSSGSRLEQAVALLNAWQRWYSHTLQGEGMCRGTAESHLAPVRLTDDFLRSIPLAEVAGHTADAAGEPVPLAGTRASLDGPDQGPADREPATS